MFITLVQGCLGKRNRLFKRLNVFLAERIGHATSTIPRSVSPARDKAMGDGQIKIGKFSSVVKTPRQCIQKLGLTHLDEPCRLVLHSQSQIGAIPSSLIAP